ncbi:hypothetical protein NYE24_31535 [Paenibacillus sp. FSL H7-0350]|uniref:hypothetical protein n=1 Tax=Paenibacillus sp. FSL H7-0350 TaxID=2975345 RepID=UPI00315842CB
MSDYRGRERQVLGEGRAGQGRAGQGRAGQGRAGQGKARQGQGEDKDMAVAPASAPRQ